MGTRVDLCLLSGDFFPELCSAEIAGPHIDVGEVRRAAVVDVQALAAVVIDQLVPVERLMNRRKQFRAVATRYDKLGHRHRTAVQIADILIWLRAKPDKPRP